MVVCSVGQNTLELFLKSCTLHTDETDKLAPFEVLKDRRRVGKFCHSTHLLCRWACAAREGIDGMHAEGILVCGAHLLSANAVECN